MYNSNIKNVKLLPGTAYTKRERNTKYLLELDNYNLLFPFYTEAGLNGRLNRKIETTHGGWDNPLSQIRGTFTGHWLSAAAKTYQETNNEELKARANFIVSEIKRCQIANGGQWAFPIPEKYLHGLTKGQYFWAPLYVCHKVMMGLLDMYKYVDNKLSLDIIKNCAVWFLDYSKNISRELMDEIMDVEETGGIMEFWLDLYDITRDENHLTLAKRFQRPKLTDPIYEGKDMLTNIHANTTGPEIHGCARMYELTNNEKYKKIVENYWNSAVTNRGQYATGGQTNGEIWTPDNKQSARLSDLNQEHCVVYNMIRLADYLYRWSGDVKYLDYIEQNTINGIFAQTHWEARYQDTAGDQYPPKTGLIAYFLPLAANSHKNWGSKTEDFWCCHCTLVQSSSTYREYIYYNHKEHFTVAQYLPSVINTTWDDIEVTITQTESDLVGECIRVLDVSMDIEDRPSYNQMHFKIETKNPVNKKIRFRIPWWINGDITVSVDGQSVKGNIIDGYLEIQNKWNNNIVVVTLPKKLTTWPLADEKETVAFLDGPVLLAGLVEDERTLYGDIDNPDTMLTVHHERQWADWMPMYKTKNQQFGFYFKPLYEIGNEKYSIYFPVKKARD